MFLRSFLDTLLKNKDVIEKMEWNVSSCWQKFEKSHPEGCDKIQLDNYSALFNSSKVENVEMKDVSISFIDLLNI